MTAIQTVKDAEYAPVSGKVVRDDEIFLLMGAEAIPAPPSPEFMAALLDAVRGIDIGEPQGFVKGGGGYGGYRYYTINQVRELLPVLRERGVQLLPEVVRAAVSAHGTTVHTIVMVRIHIYVGGMVHTTTWVEQSRRADDKGVPAAVAQAIKYTLVNLGLLPYEEADEPDRVEQNQPAQQPRAQTHPAQQQPRPQPQRTTSSQPQRPAPATQAPKTNR